MAAHKTFHFTMIYLLLRVLFFGVRLSRCNKVYLLIYLLIFSQNRRIMLNIIVNE